MDQGGIPPATPEAPPPPEGRRSQRLGRPPASPLPPHPPRAPGTPPPGAERYPGWPAWYAPAAFVAGIAGTFLLVSVVGGIFAAAGEDIDGDSAAFTIVGTLVQGSVFIGVAVLFAAMTAPPRPADFGLRRAPFWPSVGWAALGMVCFYVLAGLYSALLDPQGEQRVTEALGADQGTLTLVLAGLVVIVFAPVAEEVFFRGFFFGALRGRFALLPAALINGVLFGLVHFTGSGTLALLPILGVLGLVFCLVYERTGSLYPVIAMHAVNNTVAFSVQADGSTAVALTLGVLMVTACAIAPRVLARSEVATVVTRG